MNTFQSTRTMHPGNSHLQWQTDWETVGHGVRWVEESDWKHWVESSRVERRWRDKEQAKGKEQLRGHGKARESWECTKKTGFWIDLQATSTRDMEGMQRFKMRCAQSMEQDASDMASKRHMIWPLRPLGVGSQCEEWARHVVHEQLLESEGGSKWKTQWRASEGRSKAIRHSLSR